MVRVLRYPRLSAFCCAATFAFALGRDACVSAGLGGWARMLLYATLMGLASCFALISCRLTVDEGGIGVGFLLRMRRTGWEELAALGALCCNSRRVYLYGLYRGTPDFLHMLHRAPQCGRWGFVAPLNRRLSRAVQTYCPYGVDLSPVPGKKRPKGMRLLWHQAALYTVAMLPAAAVALVTAGLMMVRGARVDAPGRAFVLMLGAAAMCLAGVFLLRCVVNALLTCPAISEAGVCIGRGLFMAWEDVYFGYVHRMGHMSGLFFLSRALDEVTRPGSAPVLCLSMPDTSTLVLAYLTYCPHAPLGMDA